MWALVSTSPMALIVALALFELLLEVLELLLEVLELFCSVTCPVPLGPLESRSLEACSVSS